MLRIAVPLLFFPRPFPTIQNSGFPSTCAQDFRNTSIPMLELGRMHNGVQLLDPSLLKKNHSPNLSLLLYTKPPQLQYIILGRSHPPLSMSPPPPLFYALQPTPSTFRLTHHKPTYTSRKKNQILSPLPHDPRQLTQLGQNIVLRQGQKSEDFSVDLYRHKG